VCAARGFSSHTTRHDFSISKKKTQKKKRSLAAQKKLFFCTINKPEKKFVLPRKSLALRGARKTFAEKAARPHVMSRISLPHIRRQRFPPPHYDNSRH
jgi:hypothetical protein